MKRAGTLVFAVILLLLLIALSFFYVTRKHRKASEIATAGSAAHAGATYAGAEICKSCHEAEYRAWVGSDHQLAMQDATAGAVEGDFHDAKFSYFGVTSKFFTRDGKYFVNTDGPDGKLHDYEIQYTFGVHPLQQYLIPFPDGRIQALSIAWDTRPKEQGGQRWFHLYPKDNIRAGDELHWTNLQQNWNFMCAECHSTDLKKNYDIPTNTFKTTWKDINVSCEACHGAGSEHVAWAKSHPKEKTYVAGADDGLQTHFDDRHDVYWKINYITGNSQRSRPRGNTDELEMCGRCHARRSELSEDFVPGRPLLNTHLVSLLENHLYTADGQMQGEVYNYGSFLQSKMFHEGVTCSDCHDPHTQKLRDDKEKVCGICHYLPKYAATTHHFHKVGTREASCVACHMPMRTYMGVDQRHDHSFRIPRPDESIKFGTPNACNDCHADKTAAWAAKATNSWYGPNHQGFQQYTGTLTAARLGAADASSLLVSLAKDEKAPNIAKATALVELQPYLDVNTYAAARANLASPDPLLRMAAVELIGAADAATRWRMLSPLLSDPVRAVRITAASETVDAVPQEIAPADKTAFDKALQEFISVQRFNGDRPEAHLTLGNLYSRQGKAAEAGAEYNAAIKLSPDFIPAYVNMADLMRATNRDGESERWLLEAQKRSPKNAEVAYSFGLLRARQHRTAEALPFLERATNLAPDNPHYAYVYGVGLYSAGQRPQGIGALQKANQRFPGNREILLGTASLCADAGDVTAAKAFAEKFRDVAPADPRGDLLLQELNKKAQPD